MVDRMETMVWMETMDLLKMERQSRHRGTNGGYYEWRITRSDNFGTYRRMCGFGGGECRSVNRTLHEKCKYNISDLIMHK